MSPRRSGQKLILSGRTLTSLDHSKTLFECRVANNSKVMVLGKRFDPEGDEAFKRVAEVEKRSLEVGKRLAEVAKEAQDIEDGYLAKEHHAQAREDLALALVVAYLGSSSNSTVAASFRL